MKKLLSLLLAVGCMTSVACSTNTNQTTIATTSVTTVTETTIAPTEPTVDRDYGYQVCGLDVADIQFLDSERTITSDGKSLPTMARGSSVKLQVIFNADEALVDPYDGSTKIEAQIILFDAEGKIVNGFYLTQDDYNYDCIIGEASEQSVVLFRINDGLIPYDFNAIVTVYISNEDNSEYSYGATGVVGDASKVSWDDVCLYRDATE